MFTSGGEAQRVPLRLLENEPALSRIPVVLVEEAAQSTLADQFCTVERRFGRGIEEQSERSPEAALLVRRGRDGQELICQNADALPRRSVILTLPDSLGWERFPAVMQVQLLSCGSTTASRSDSVMFKSAPRAGNSRQPRNPSPVEHQIRPTPD